MNLEGNHITWLGHATFRIETKDGVTVYVDPGSATRSVRRTRRK